MAKKVVIITTSLRYQSNSDTLANQCALGAKEAGNDVEVISLKGKTINYCIGCLSCQKTNKCCIQDDMAEIVSNVKNADTIVFATPLYYYGISGQMKTVLDRLNPLYSSDYQFKDVYLIVSAAEDEQDTFDKGYIALQGFVDCFEKARLKGMLSIGGVDKANQVATNQEALAKAYAFGKNL